MSWNEPRYVPDGPWALDEDNEGKVTVYVADESEDICDIVVEGGDIKRAIAIGRFVASTPDLLIELKKLVEREEYRIEAWNEGVGMRNRNLAIDPGILDEARAAIAKAEWRRKRIRHNRGNSEGNAC
jgi:hypothetical protein